MHGFEIIGLHAPHSPIHAPASTNQHLHHSPTNVRTKPHTLPQILRHFHAQFKAQLSGPWAPQAAVSHDDGGESAKKKSKTDATAQKRLILEHVTSEELGAAKEVVR